MEPRLFEMGFVLRDPQSGSARICPTTNTIVHNLFSGGFDARPIWPKWPNVVVGLEFYFHRLRHRNFLQTVRMGNLHTQQVGRYLAHMWLGSDGTIIWPSGDPNPPGITNHYVCTNIRVNNDPFISSRHRNIENFETNE